MDWIQLVGVSDEELTVAKKSLTPSILVQKQKIYRTPNICKYLGDKVNVFSIYAT